MGNIMKMLANLTIRTSSYYSSIYSYSCKPRQQQATAGYSRRWRPEMVAPYKSPVALEKDASSTAVVPSWERPRQNWRACPGKGGKKAWQEATRAFGSLVKPPWRTSDVGTARGEKAAPSGALAPHVRLHRNVWF